MPGIKRCPMVPRHVHWWLSDISKADLIETLIKVCSMNTEEGCDDIDAAADEAALEIAKTIDYDGRKPPKSLLWAAMRRPPEEHTIRGTAPASPKMDDAGYDEFRRSQGIRV